MANQRARIEPGDDGDAVPRQERAGLGIRTPVAGDGREFANHQAFDVRPRGFVIALAGSVVADLGIGEDDDLAGVRRVGEDFLIAGEGGVENHFPGPFGRGAKTPALEDRAVFQGENGRVQVELFLPRCG